MSEQRVEYRSDVMVTITWPLQDVVDLAVGVDLAARHWRLHVRMAKELGQPVADVVERVARYDELYQRLSRAIAGQVK